MDKEQENTLDEYIRRACAAMRTKEDFLSVVNRVHQVLSPLGRPISMRQFNFFTFPAHVHSAYSSFTLRKKSGGTRVVHAPHPRLKTLQQSLSRIFQALYPPHPAATAYVPRRSVVDNARRHAGKYYVLNLDLKDFFPSIDQARIWGRLQRPPFDWNRDRGLLPIANAVASICCLELLVERPSPDGSVRLQRRNVLPQGAPTSPALSNLVCQRLDRDLTRLAKQHGAVYSRYADDLTFSSMHQLYQPDGVFMVAVRRIIERENFRINDHKTRLHRDGYRKLVTGLVVNEFPNVGRKYIRSLRKWLYLWQEYGYPRANYYFARNCRASLHHRYGEQPPSLSEWLGGRLAYLKMVTGPNDRYVKLHGRWSQLVGQAETVLG
jgi:RNA-directed DNA polymerase